MSTPHDQGGGGRVSKPHAPVVPTNTVDRSTASPTQQAHATARSDPATAVDHTQRPFINRSLTGQANTASPARQNMSSSVGRNPPPSASSTMRKRGLSRAEEEIAKMENVIRAAKRPANASTRSDLASGDAAVAHGGMFIGNTNEGRASSERERLESMSPGAVDAGAAGMSQEPAYVKSEQTSAEMRRPLVSRKYKTAASTRAPVTDGPWARPRSDSMDRSAHGGHRQPQGIFSPGAPGLECRACGSQRHMTKECQIPSKDGTVAVCPFHDCTVYDKTGPQSHPLDGNTQYDPGSWVKAPLYCDIVMRYKMAVQSNHTPRIRQMLPQIFKELVIKRRRRPCCRVVSKEVCPINLTIEYSLEFCHGKMPEDLQGMWPYTMWDATDPAICAKLRHFDEHGLKAMPPGELESKSWEQIKREYAEGIIPPQIRSKHRPYHPTGMVIQPSAELGDTEAHLRAPSADVEPQAVDENGGGQGSLVQENAVQSQDTVKTNVLLQTLDVLSEKLDTLTEKVDALSALPEKVDQLAEKVDALSEKKKDFLYKILDSLP